MTFLLIGGSVITNLGLLGQAKVSIHVKHAESLDELQEVELYVTPGNLIYKSDEKGNMLLESLPFGTYELLFVSPSFEIHRQQIKVEQEKIDLTIRLKELSYELSEVVISQRRKELFALRRLKDVEGTAIYAGKKNEVVLIDELTANLGAGNARQIYAQVSGLNIYESNDAGLQLSIGGRGLDPNRTANFNTRQNGYDISADVLGYPESYYTPPVEALGEVQVIRGAASLQYGTQFGGLINFKMKEHISDKKVSWISRQTIGSYNLFTSFNRVSGTVNEHFSYQVFFNHKRGDGFRPNSGFQANNTFVDLHFAPSEKTFIDLELTHMNYLAQQAGGLTDAQFYKDITFSNRERNWFAVDWRLASLRIEHKLNPKTELSLNLFALDASRKAVGFRTNRVSQTDDITAPRDLIVGDFNNWGAEGRYLSRYKLGGKEAIYLLGVKYYQSNNFAIQGPGTTGFDADFSLATEEHPFYPNQSDFRFPNLNLAAFGEHILHLNDKLTVTPGFRFEYINTQSEGDYKRINFDLAGNPIQDTTFADNRTFERAFVLLGIGMSYKPNDHMEAFANISQNYRSVTFSDIRIVNPSFQIDPNISDESGFTADAGFRGRFKNYFSYDIGLFAIMYNNRLGEVLRAEQVENVEGELVETGRVIRYRGNIGQALMLGMESLVEWNIAKTFFPNKPEFKLSTFVNASAIRSEYISSEIPGVEGKEVEFIPDFNIKTGLNFGYKNFLGSLQYSYLGEQFTDASNAPQLVSDNQSGIRGSIPAYDVVDLSLSYSFKFLKFEGGINNLLNERYFTRRATGYPGPGIIPSAPRTFYLGVQFKLER